MSYFDTKSQSFKDMMVMIDSMATQFNIPKDDLITKLLQISFHETAGTYDDQSIQLQGKPGQEGMGAFHFEYGKSQGGHTAINRLIQINEDKHRLLDSLGVATAVADTSKFPPYLKNLPISKGTATDPEDLYFSGSQGFDARTFSPSEQWMLMIADISKDLELAKISDISNISSEDLWIDHHAIPDATDEAARRATYQGNMNIWNVPSEDPLTQPILDQLLNYNP